MCVCHAVNKIYLLTSFYCFVSYFSALDANKDDTCIAMTVCLFQGSKLQLSNILSDQDVLFNFMKFMKAEASVNVLQFYLSVGMSTLACTDF